MTYSLQGTSQPGAFRELFSIHDEKADVCGGLTPGYRSFSWRDDLIGSEPDRYYSSALFMGDYFGGKSYFNERIGGFLDLGDMGLSNGRFGPGFKLWCPWPFLLEYYLLNVFHCSGYLC